MLLTSAKLTASFKPVSSTSSSILHKSIAGRYRPARVADGPITARCRFMKNASWDSNYPKYLLNSVYVEWAVGWETEPWNIWKQRRYRPACTSAQSGQDLCCSPTQYRDHVEYIGLIAKILTQRVARQTGLGLRHSYMHLRPFCQSGPTYDTLMLPRIAGLCVWP